MDGGSPGTAAPRALRLRPDHRSRRRAIDLEDRLAADARLALALSYLGFLAFALLAPVAVLLALRARRRIRRAGVGEVWLGTTTVALILAFGQAILVGLVALALLLR